MKAKRRIYREDLLEAAQKKLRPFDQRPDRDLAAPILKSLLDEAITYGYGTGSIGCTTKTNDDVFEYEVSFKIVRRKCTTCSSKASPFACETCKGSGLKQPAGAP